MSTMPERIWANKEEWWVPCPVPHDAGYTEYVRADVVERYKTLLVRLRNQMQLEEWGDSEGWKECFEGLVFE